MLASAFADDATLAFLVPGGTSDRPERLRQMFRAEIHSCGFGQVDVALDDRTGEVLGVGAWVPPYVHLPTLTAIRWSAVSAGALGVRGLRAGARYDRELGHLRPSDPHWHLLDLGTLPAIHGQGVGTALLEHRLTQVDHECRSAFLETTTREARRLYERFGFETVGRLPRVTGGAYAMVRPRSLRG